MNRFYSIIHDLNNKFAERTAREILVCESRENFASALANRGTEMRIRKEIESYVADGLLAGDEDWLPRRLPFVVDYAFGYLDIGYDLQEAVEHAVEDAREEAAV